jgi:protein required for attachment to host cells
MQTTWIVAADSSRARIFEMQGAQDHLHEIEDFVNSAGRENAREINTDARGRYYGGGRAQGDTAEPRVDPVEHETDLFSKRVSEYLDQARVEHRYDRLRLIAFPKFLGLLRQNLSKEAQDLVEDEVSKNITMLDAREIEDYVKTRLQ